MPPACASKSAKFTIPVNINATRKTPAMYSQDAVINLEDLRTLEKNAWKWEYLLTM
jgi:hypothetical protein